MRTPPHEEDRRKNPSPEDLLMARKLTLADVRERVKSCHDRGAFDFETIVAAVYSMVPVLQRGTSISRACARIGLKRTTLQYWKDNYPWVNVELSQAETFLDIAAEDVIHSAIMGGIAEGRKKPTAKEMKAAVDAAKWRLEHKLSTEYHKQQKIVGTLDDTDNPYEYMDDEDLKEINRKLDEAKKKMRESQIQKENPN